MAIWYGIGLILCAFVSTATSNPYQLYAFQIGMKIRVLCTSLIYRKVIESKYLKHKNNTAQAIDCTYGYVSIDNKKYFFFFGFIR